MEDSSKRFVSRSVFPVWQLVQISRIFVHIQILLSSNAWAIQFLFMCDCSNIQKPVTNLSSFQTISVLQYEQWRLVFHELVDSFPSLLFFPHSFLIHNVARARTLLSFPVTIFFFLWKLASDCSGSIYFRENTCKQINLFRFQVTWCVFLSHF